MSVGPLSRPRFVEKLRFNLSMYLFGGERPCPWTNKHMYGLGESEVNAHLLAVRKAMKNIFEFACRKERFASQHCNCPLVIAPALVHGVTIFGQRYLFTELKTDFGNPDSQTGENSSFLKILELCACA